MDRPRLKGKALAEAAEQLLGYAFRDENRLQRALTHASARGAAGADYERLEFLGDRVLGFVIAEMLFNDYPAAREGELSLRLNALVNAETLAEIADETGLVPLIRAGADIKTLAGRKRINLRADVMES
jgi:ribonuclease-3